MINYVLRAQQDTTGNLEIGRKVMHTKSTDDGH